VTSSWGENRKEDILHSCGGIPRGSEKLEGKKEKKERWARKRAYMYLSDARQQHHFVVVVVVSESQVKVVRNDDTITASQGEMGRGGVFQVFT
jgi:hypothetical protein